MADLLREVLAARAFNRRAVGTAAGGVEKARATAAAAAYEAAAAKLNELFGERRVGRNHTIITTSHHFEAAMVGQSYARFYNRKFHAHPQLLGESSTPNTLRPT